MVVFGTSRPVRFVLKVRGLYAIAAFTQTTLEGHPMMGVGVLAVVAAAYWQPYAARRVVRLQKRIGDEYVAEQGLGPAVAALLSGVGASPV